MIWRGQLKAIMAIIAVAGLVISLAIYNTTGSVGPFFWLLVLIPLAALGFGILNTLSTAFRGKPLAYDIKIFDERLGPRIFLCRWEVLQVFLLHLQAASAQTAEGCGAPEQDFAPTAELNTLRRPESEGETRLPLSKIKSALRSGMTVSPSRLRSA